jgi:tripartite-type tricarboxylate transporter receptor subunit TctC
MSKLARRRILRLAMGAIAAPALVRAAGAKSFPDRPVRIMVGFAPGGPHDVIARLIAPWLSERLGRPFIVENRAGAAGNVAAEAVVRAPPDGHVLLMMGVSSAINASLYDSLPFDLLRDIAPVASLIATANVLVVNPSVPARTVAELVSHARSHPGELNMASPGVGTGPHVAGELFKMMAGIDLVHVPYRGNGPAFTDLLSGQVDLMFPASVGLTQYVQAGTLRALAVTTRTRSEALPDIATIGEFVPGYEASTWFGMGAPNGTPADVVAVLNGEINAGLADPRIRARLAAFGGVALAGAPADFGELIAAEVDKWAKVVRFASIKPE